MRTRRMAAAVAMAAFASRALGSGDPTPSPVYVFADPQVPAERAMLADGQIGIVKGATTDALLYLDWRRLNGLAVGQTAADALASPCCGTPGTAQNDWLDARRKVPGTGQLYWIAADREGLHYLSVPTCFDDAFLTAAATLGDRVRRYGVAAPAVRAWVAGQDAVFAACSKPIAGLPPLPTDAPAWLRADRAYQEAALALYDGHTDEAARRFDLIARDPASPWRPLGLYLVARAVQRGAIDAPSPARFAAAHAALDRLVQAPAGTYGQGQVARMRRILEFHEHPDLLLARLDRDLAAHEPIPDIAVAFRDYMTLSDRRPDRPEAADWIRTIQAKDRAAGLTHALARWRAGGKVAWLVAALTLAEPGDANATALAAAADRIAPIDPAWLTARYHRLRLLMSTADPATIRTDADAILARRDLTRSDRNVFEAVRAQVAASLPDFIEHALREPYCLKSDAACLDAPLPSGDELIGRTSSGAFAGLGPDARAVIDRLPLAQRMTLVDAQRLPHAIRLDIALTSYVRAVQLQDDRAVDRLASRLIGLLPQVRDDWRSIARTAHGADKRFAEAFVMAKIPSLRADLADYARPVGTTRQFAGYWVDLRLPTRGAPSPARPFAPASAYLADGWEYGAPNGDPKQEAADLTCLDRCGGGAFPLHVPPFARPSLARALLERRSFLSARATSMTNGSGAIAGSGVSIWSEALGYVADHPRDPRSPEMLYRLIRVARWGGNPDHLGRRAFRLLHARYPVSAWTRQSPFFYDS